MTPAPRLAVVSRDNCPLCEEMRLALAATLARTAPALVAAVTVIAVDSDPTLQRRFGLKVPVLLLDGEPVCHGHFDAAEFSRLLRGRGIPQA